MFCGHCGSVVKDTFKFCVKCGNSTSNNTETHSSTSDSTSRRKGRAECATSGIATSDLTLISSKPVPTLDIFMNNKKEERKSHFKKKSKKTKRMTEKEDPPVTVNIGIMRYIEEENMLKPQRGKSLPLRIGRTADGEELLKLAVAKHSKHNANEITHSSPLAYKLLYPDGIAVNKLKRIRPSIQLTRIQS